MYVLPLTSATADKVDNLGAHVTEREVGSIDVQLAQDLPVSTPGLEQVLRLAGGLAEQLQVDTDEG